MISAGVKDIKWNKTLARELIYTQETYQELFFMFGFILAY